MKKNNIKILSCGYCTQYEKIILPSGKWEKIKFPANAFVIPLKEGVLLFDTGYPSDFEKCKNNILVKLYKKLLPTYTSKESSCLTQLKNRNINNIKYVFISHFHPDHIGGLKDFTNTKFICSKNEYKNLKGIQKIFANLFLPEDFETNLIFIEDFEKSTIFPEFTSYKIENNIWAIHLPGHTEHQYGLYYKNDNVLIVADAIWTNETLKKEEFPCYLAMNLMENKREYKETIYKLKKNFDREKINILYSHQEDIS